MTHNLTLNAQLSIKNVHDQLMNIIFQEKREKRKKKKQQSCRVPNAACRAQFSQNASLYKYKWIGCRVCWAQPIPTGPTTSKGTVGDANARPNNGRNQLQCCGLYN